MYGFVFFSSILFHNKKRSIHNIPDRYCMNLSDIMAIKICKQGSDNMRIAICDDEVSIVQILEEKIKKLLPDAVIDKYLSGDELIASGSKPDILFLDIQMPGMDGMETAKMLRQDNEDMILIFVTAAEEYVFQAFDVGAFHYLVKPFSDEKLKEVVTKAVHNINCLWLSHLNLNREHILYIIMWVRILRAYLYKGVQAVTLFPILPQGSFHILESNVQRGKQILSEIALVQAGYSR